MTTAEHAAADLLLDWLAPRDPLSGSFDAVIGFGHFDLRIVDRCAELFRGGKIMRVIFTGGIGAGTADLGQPEADAFLAHARRFHPDVPQENIVVENRSTNTAENIAFTLARLKDDRPTLRLERTVLVANPSRQRRVMHTWQQLVPDCTALSGPPVTSLDRELELFTARRQDLITQLVGEVDRLISYAARGWISRCDVPDFVRAAAETCRGVRR